MLSDSDRAVGEAYEVTRPSTDRYADFPRRHSYLIAPSGLIHRAYDVTDVAAHADDVLGDMERASTDP